MSGVKHTLRIEDGANSHFFDGRILDQDDECLAFVDIHHPMSAIFAAAPDLLEALVMMADAVDPLVSDPPIVGPITQRVRMALVEARAAIARARGEQDGGTE